MPVYEAPPAQYPVAAGYPAPVAPPPAPPVAPPAPVAAPTAAPIPVAAEHRRFDWVLGIVLGIVLGLAVAAGFVFIGSEDTVDAPRIHGIENDSPPEFNGREASPGEAGKLPAK
jgi:hypothetical protein